MIAIFNILHYICFDRLVKSVGMGVTPKTWLDAFGFNVFVQFLYCIWEWPLKLYYIVPFIGAYWLYSMIAPFLGGGGSAAPEKEEKKSNRQRKKEIAEQTGKPTQRVKY